MSFLPRAALTKAPGNGAEGNRQTKAVVPRWAAAMGRVGKQASKIRGVSRGFTVLREESLAVKLAP